MKLNCYKVYCKDSLGNVHDVGLIASDEDAAKHVVENSLLEGKHIKATAFKVEEVDAI